MRTRTIGALAVATAALMPLTTIPAHAAPDTTVPLSTYNAVDHTASMVTSVALPTVQTDGIVWNLATSPASNTVYAGGSFANTRPAGAAAGTQLTPRANVLAFDLNTGKLAAAFRADTNGPVKAVTLTPDGQHLIIGGSFTTVNGVARQNIAEVDAVTGAVDPTWHPAMNAPVNAVAVRGDGTIYAGGSFSNAAGMARQHLAAFTATGTLTTWAPTTDEDVRSMAVTPDQSAIIAGGTFTTAHGPGQAASVQPATAKFDAVTGAVLPWAMNQTMNISGGYKAGAYSVRSDGIGIDITFWAYGKPGFEGVVRANPADGSIITAADCHGDSYDTTVLNQTLYAVSHEHDCDDQGSWATTPNPSTGTGQWYHRATAFTLDAHGVTKPYNGTAYSTFPGLPAPAQADWYPSLSVGTVSGAGQAAWAATSANNVLVLGGEFPAVNGRAQQSLVRFAVAGVDGAHAASPQTFTTQPTMSDTTLTAQRTLTWQTTWSTDAQNLTYQVWRTDADGTHKQLITTQVVASTFWDRPTETSIDTTAVAGVHYLYAVTATAAGGGTVTSATVAS